METIIALLFVLLPIIFKLIAKRLEKSGKDDTARRVRELARELGVDEDEVPIAQWLKEAEAEAEAEARGEVLAETAVEKKEFVPQLVLSEEARNRKVEPFVPRKVIHKPQQTRKPVVGEEQPKKGEKIDPKKLVVYSEIMKPKYTE